MAPKKRQREEEERKKERKRMRVEARRQRREHEDKLPAEKLGKEMKGQSIDGRGPGGKKSKDETENKKMDKERGFDNSRNISETEPSTSRISISNAKRENIIHEELHETSSSYGYKAEVPSNLDREMEISLGITSQVQYYDISPYKESDDENDDDDNVIPNSKFIPSWSRIEQTQRQYSPQKAFDASLKVLLWFKATIFVAIALAFWLVNFQILLD